jgi:hypothetical protein
MNSITEETLGKAKEMLDKAQVVALKLLTDNLEKARSAALDADLNHAALVGRLNRREELGMPRDHCTGWTHEGAIRESQTKLDRLRDELEVAQLAADFVAGALAGAKVELLRQPSVSQEVE